MANKDMYFKKLRKTYENVKDYSLLEYPICVSYNEDKTLCYIYYPDLDGCDAEGVSFEEALVKAKKAKEEWIHNALNKNQKIPMPYEYNYHSGNFRMRVPKELHESLVKNAEKRGMSLNKYCIELLRKG